MTQLKNTSPSPPSPYVYIIHIISYFVVFKIVMTKKKGLDDKNGRHDLYLNTLNQYP